MNQSNSRVLSILSSEGMAGLSNRIVSHIVRKPQLINLYVLKLDYQSMVKFPPPEIDLEIKELTKTDDPDIETVAKFGFYGRSRGDILQYLADGQQCYVAKHKGEVICCYWKKTGVYYDHYLKRRLELDDGEEYFLGAFTLPEFRRMGILSYLNTASLSERTQNCPNWRAIIFIRVNNKVSLGAAEKQGFTMVGRIGFAEILGVRFHFLLGRDALPKISRRNFIQIFSDKP